MRIADMLDQRRAWRFTFLAFSAGIIVVFLLISNNLVKQLAQQERERMHIWAEATQRLAQADFAGDYEFLLTIISQNNSIPVLIADEEGTILDSRNFNLPEPDDPELPGAVPVRGANGRYLADKLKAALGDTPLSKAGEEKHIIRVEIFDNVYQYIYYEDSILLRRLSWYPYIQLAVMIVLALIIYLAVVYTKRAEQNRVWVGLSKETAHQLGTPISSLMAWTQYLEASGTDPEIVGEIDKDVRRLTMIAERFSKIGSDPELKPENPDEIIASALAYMRSRLSGRVRIAFHESGTEAEAMMSRPLFEWVMENLTKNAVDAMRGEGNIDIYSRKERDKLIIDVKDTGKGIARKNFQNVFNPGFTTKKRGWGLGLTLVKRIVEEYHGGKIFVKESEPGVGTTFRIELPLTDHKKTNRQQ